MNRSRLPKSIDFGTKALLGPSPSSASVRQAESQPKPRPFAAASSVQAYLASLQAKVKAKEKSEDSEDSTSTSTEDRTVVSQRTNVRGIDVGSESATSEESDSTIGRDKNQRRLSIKQLSHEINVKKANDRKNVVSKPPDDDVSSDESSSGSVSTIFNVRSLSEIASVSSDVQPSPPPQKPLPATKITPQKPPAKASPTATESSTSETEDNVHSFGSLDVPTEIENPLQIRTASSISEHQNTSKAGTSLPESLDEYHTASALETETSSDKDHSDTEDLEYESDFEPSEHSEDESEARQDESTTSSARSMTSASTSRVSPRPRLRDTAAQKHQSVAKSVQTDAYPPAILSVAEYFHTDTVLGPSASATSAAFDARMALANYRAVVHPASMQNRLIASVLEAHLHCIRTFAEGQKAIYDHWNDILNEHKALTSHKRQNRKGRRK